jgi:hypothetical protein
MRTTPTDLFSEVTRMSRRFAVSLILSLASLPLSAADHADGPAATADPSADITDVFAWTSADGKSLNLVMGTSPFATTASKFSNTVQ